MNEKNKDLLQTVEEEAALIQAVMHGEGRNCPTCGTALRFVPPNSGRHPGIYCDQGCTAIMLSMRAEPKK